MSKRWQPYHLGRTIGTKGSETGTIIADETFGEPIIDDPAEFLTYVRITLETGCRTAPFAITIAVNSWMARTIHLASEQSANERYKDLKPALVLLSGALNKVGWADRHGKGADLIDAFVRRFPGDKLSV